MSGNEPLGDHAGRGRHRGHPGRSPDRARAVRAALCRRFGRAPAGSHRLRRGTALSRRYGPQDRRAGTAVARRARAGRRDAGGRVGDCGGLDAGLGGDDARAHRRQADARAGRGYPDRFRRRIRPSSRRRRRRAQCERRGRGGRGPPTRNAPAVHRDTHQAVVGGAPPARPAHARSVRHGAGAGARGRFVPGFRVTIPKVVDAAQVAAVPRLL